MFQDFIYLDIDRVQSILAQLQHGLLNELIGSLLLMDIKIDSFSGKQLI